MSTPPNGVAKMQNTPVPATGAVKAQKTSAPTNDAAQAQRAATSPSVTTQAQASVMSLNTTQVQTAATPPNIATQIPAVATYPNATAKARSASTPLNVTPKAQNAVTLTIDDIGTKGEGIGHLDGMAVFVPGCLPGEVVRARLVHGAKRYWVGELLEIVQSSPDRVAPRCPHFGACGGCQLQHLAYEAQCRYKENVVRQALLRIGGVDVPLRGIVGADTPWRYRNKAQFPVGSKASIAQIPVGKGAAGDRQTPTYGCADAVRAVVDGVQTAACGCADATQTAASSKADTPQIGFYAHNSHSLIDIGDCLIQHADVAKITATVKEYMRQSGCVAYDEASGRGQLRHVFVRGHAGKHLVMLVTNGWALPQKENLCAKLMACTGVVGVAQNCNRRRDNVILGPECQTLAGQAYIEIEILGASWRVSPLSFLQVNIAQAERLYQIAIAAATEGFASPPNALDVYCGIGTLTLGLARKCATVCGIESVPEAIADAKAAALHNHVKNVEFQCGDAAVLLTNTQKKPDVVVLDPPRRGCEKPALEALRALGPGRVVYVSCNPATLARDIRELTHDGTYQVQYATPVDLFPHTVHVETVVLLSKLKSTTSIEVKIDLDEMVCPKCQPLGGGH